LHHPNHFYALSAENLNPGTIRESFFLNKVGAFLPVTFATEGGDFKIKDLIFETGGASKMQTKLILHQTKVLLLQMIFKMATGIKFQFGCSGFFIESGSWSAAEIPIAKSESGSRSPKK
jgi:hypothetical protein